MIAVSVNTISEEVAMLRQTLYFSSPDGHYQVSAQRKLQISTCFLSINSENIAHVSSTLLKISLVFVREVQFTVNTSGS